MKAILSAAAALAVLSLPGLAQAEPDLAKGEKTFGQCRACHALTAPDGTVIHKGGITGPDLYGVVGRKIGSVEGFRYGTGIEELAEKFPDAVWDVQSLTAYVKDPGKYLKEHTGNSKAKTKMTFRLGKDHEDLMAYLLANSPDAPEQPGEGDGAPQP